MSSLSNRLSRVESEIGVPQDDRPTPTDLWLWQLEDAVADIIERHGGRAASPTDAWHDPFVMYAHRFCLKSRADVQAAPDRVLFEALGFDGEPVWGWLQFMISKINFFVPRAANWGLPTIRGTGARTG